MKVITTKDPDGTTQVAVEEPDRGAAGAELAVAEAGEEAVVTRMPDFPPGPCAETDPELWFPDRGNDVTADRARSICRSSCLSRVECLAYALAHHEEGIWGGFNEKGRERARRQHRAGKPLEVIIAEDDEKVRARQEKSRQVRLAAAARKRNAERALSRQRAEALRIAS